MKIERDRYIKKVFVDSVEYRGKRYLREEDIVRNSIWRDEKGNTVHVHIIKWTLLNDDPNSEDFGEMKEYFSADAGWGNEKGDMKISNPIPKIEQIFQKEMKRENYLTE